MRTLRSLFSNNISLTILVYPFSGKKIPVVELISMDRIRNSRQLRKCGIFEVQRRFALGELQLLSKLENPTVNQVQSVTGALQWVSKMRPRLRPFLAGLYAFFENRNGPAENWQKQASTY